MKPASILSTLSFATISLAAPATLTKRIAASITLYTDKKFAGTSYTIPFDINEVTCVAPTLPASIDKQASSVKLSATGDGNGFNCRLSANQNCEIDNTANATWFFNVDVPDLSEEAYSLDDRARSVLCEPV